MGLEGEVIGSSKRKKSEGDSSEGKKMEGKDPIFRDGDCP